MTWSFTGGGRGLDGSSGSVAFDVCTGIAVAAPGERAASVLGSTPSSAGGAGTGAGCLVVGAAGTALTSASSAGSAAATGGEGSLERCSAGDGLVTDDGGSALADGVGATASARWSSLLQAKSAASRHSGAARATDPAAARRGQGKRLVDMALHLGRAGARAHGRYGRSPWTPGHYARARRFVWLIVALLMASTPPVLGGIIDTPHNMLGAEYGAAEEEDSTAVCAFCHTPHGDAVAPPEWQSTLPNGSGTFRTYNSFGRTVSVEGVEAGSVSFVCMSCHDGTQAPNVALNMPATRRATAKADVPKDTFSRAVRTPRIDLRRSHPVGMPYRGLAPGAGIVAGDSAVARGGPAVDPREPDPLGFQGYRPAEQAIIDGAAVWWLETGGAGRQRSDIHLYSRGTPEGAAVPYVECSSCHDPHMESPGFLRTGARRDTVCSSCHAL